MESNKKEKIVKELIRIFWVFVIGSLVGCIVETIVGIIFDRSFQLRQGLIYGPFIPVYGIGAILFYLVIHKIHDLRKVFCISMVLGGTIEFLCSYFQELWFGTVSWDYSEMFLNIGGRTSLLFCFFWGIAGLLFVKYVLPAIQKIDLQMYNTKFQYLTIALLVFMSFNIIISCAAGARQNKRMQKIEARSSFDAFLDKHYPDKLLDKVYHNKINKIKQPVQG